MVKFDEEKHLYTLEKNGNALISATSLIGKYKPKFDADTNADRVAKKEGLTKEFILNLWAKERDDAANYGTYIHKIMEDYIKLSIRDEKYATLYESFDSVKKNINFNIKGIKSESILFNEHFMVAGTADIIFENDKYFYVLDFKTNKRFNFTNNFHDFFKSPLDHLPVCEFNTYGLQLSLYAYLYGKMTGKKCKGLQVLYKENNLWRGINLNYMQKEIIDLLLDYKTPS